MELSNIINTMGIWVYALAIVIFILVLGLIFVKIYRKTSKEEAFIRTGLGGAKVILDGGSIMLPMVHELTMINLNTLKLVVTRRDEQALITSDKLKVDIIVEFFVRVKRDEDSISRAAATLGSKTLHPEDLKALIEGKLVDALRSVASQTTMESLHVERKEFVQKVSNTVAEDLDTNGLELESVSLTSLDQTNIKFFNEDNAFDAQGLRKIAEITEAKRKEKVEIEVENRVLVETKRLEAEKRILEIRQDEAFAKAAQESSIRIEQSQKAKEAREQEILNEKAVDFANIQKNKEVEEREILKHRALETERIQKDEALRIAEQTKDIKLSEKSREVAIAEAQANIEKAKEIKTKEAIITSKEIEVANRDKELALIRALQEAEQEAVMKKTLATAEKEAAEDKALAKQIEADGEAKAIIIQAEALSQQYEVEAEGKRRINEAMNALSQEQIRKEVQLAMIEQLPKIIEQMIKPAEYIDSIKIVDMGGAGRNLVGNAVQGGDEKAAGQTLPEQITNAMMNYTVGSTMINDLLKETGLGETVGINEVRDLLRSNNLAQTAKTKPVPPAAGTQSEEQSDA